ncbi:MAG: VCBS repeat-containing protein [Magnetococcales bacterium]|nr:VCBS repeat-containing protein [Magnetococcales bacterium]
MPLDHLTYLPLLVSTTELSGLVVCDVNQDGRPDLVGTTDGNTLTIRLGIGTGQFTSAPGISIGGMGNGLISGDLDQDRDPDLVIVDFNNDRLSLLLGNGTGGFSSGPAADPVSAPGAVALGDLNRDGKLDLVVANSGNDTVSVRLGNGAGGFAAQPTLTTGAWPNGVALGDLNRDNMLDLVNGNTLDNTLTIWRGQGDGTFQQRESLAVVSPGKVVIGDLNNDGHPDLVVANRPDHLDLTNPGYAVSVLLADGSGSFQTATTYGTEWDPTDLAIADLDEDGAADLVVGSNQRTVAIFPGNGDGTFLPRIDLEIPGYSQTLAVGDLNGDGHPDLAFGSSVLIRNASTGDTTAPAAPTALDLAAEDDTGPSQTDQVTTQLTNLTISGNGESNAVLALFDDLNGNGQADGNELLGTTRVSGGGWSLDVHLDIGNHALVARQSDAAGNSSALSAPLALTILSNDTVNPQVTISSPTNNTTVNRLTTLGGAATDDDSGVARVDLQILDQSNNHYIVYRGGQFVDQESAAWVTTTTNTNDSTWSLDTGNSIWTIGHTYAVTARATDRAGNTSQNTAYFGYTLDGARMATAIDLASPLYAINATDSITINGRLRRADNGEWNLSGQTVRLTITAPNGNERQLTTTTTDQAGHFSFANVSGFAASGSHVMEVTTEASLMLGAASSYADVRVGSPAGYVILVQGEVAIQGVKDIMMAEVLGGVVNVAAEFGAGAE